MRVILAFMAVAIILLTFNLIGKPAAAPIQPVAETEGFSTHNKTDRLPLKAQQVRKPAQGRVIILPPLR
jgi:hypothetical protein